MNGLTSQQGSGLRKEMRTIRAARRDGIVTLDNDASRLARTLVFLTRPIPLTAAITLTFAVGLALAFAAGVFAGPPPAHREITTTDADGNIITDYVLDEGTYIDSDGNAHTVLASEDLPADIVADITTATDTITADDIASGAVAAIIGEKMAPTGKPYIAIVPQYMSCDGDEYFNGYAIIGDVTPTDLGDGIEPCDMLRTLEGARELAHLYDAADTANAGTFQYFEVLIDSADDVYAAQGSGVEPTVEPGVISTEEPNLPQWVDNPDDLPQE